MLYKYHNDILFLFLPMSFSSNNKVEGEVFGSQPSVCVACVSFSSNNTIILPKEWVEGEVVCCSIGRTYN